VEKIKVSEKFSLFSEEWTPKIIAESNGQLVKIAKGSGELVWHSHENEDELFMVFKGKLTIKLHDKNIDLHPGEMYVVPKGVEHCPLAEPERMDLTHNKGMQTEKPLAALAISQ
jgi:mannose-6-phosphate isomerase-like protein (cupin superfamily)